VGSGNYNEACRVCGANFAVVCERCGGWFAHELQRLLPKGRRYKAYTIAAHAEDLEVGHG
jgi:predicted amidophosphoribosyltransferase